MLNPNSVNVSVSGACNNSFSFISDRLALIIEMISLPSDALAVMFVIPY